MERKEKNFVSLIIGIILIIVGLGGIAIIPYENPIIVAPLLSLIAGEILALIGGLKKW